MKTQINLAIVGSREGISEDLVREFVCNLKGSKVRRIISGGAKGVDTWAIKEARRNGIDTLEIFPDYNTYGRYRAPKIRNGRIVDEADCVVAFWNKTSGGTLDAINQAKEKGKKVYIIFGLSNVLPVLRVLGVDVARGL